MPVTVTSSSGEAIAQRDKRLSAVLRCVLSDGTKPSTVQFLPAGSDVNAAASTWASEVAANLNASETEIASEEAKEKEAREALAKLSAEDQRKVLHDDGDFAGFEEKRTEDQKPKQEVRR